MAPFEYFYHHYVGKIKFEVGKIKAADIEEYITDIIEKEIRGEQYKLNKTQSSQVIT